MKGQTFNKELRDINVNYMYDAEEVRAKRTSAIYKSYSLQEKS